MFSLVPDSSEAVSLTRKVMENPEWIISRVSTEALSGTEGYPLHLSPRIPVRLSFVVLHSDRCFGFFWNYFRYWRINVGMNRTLFLKTIE